MDTSSVANVQNVKLSGTFFKKFLSKKVWFVHSGQQRELLLEEI